jgi:hypothetical protein
MRFIKRIEARTNATLGNVDSGVEMAKDLIADCKDGVGVTIRPRKGFSKFANRLAVSVAAYLGEYVLYAVKCLNPIGGGTNTPPTIDLTWMEETDIPLTVTLDPEVDAK